MLTTAIVVVSLLLAVEALRRAIVTYREVRDLRELVSGSTDGGPYRRQLRIVQDETSKQLQSIVRELPRAPVYCEDCRFRSGSSIYLCAAHPAGSGFATCGSVNKNHDCVHFQRRTWWNAAS